jgi:hypothetical protein
MALGTARSEQKIGPFSLGFWARKNHENWRVVSGTALLWSLFSEQGRYRWLQTGPAIRTEKESNLVPLTEKDCSEYRQDEQQ